MKMAKTLAAILLIGMLLGSSFLATDSAKGWYAYGDISPTIVTEGDTVTFSITVTNMGSDSMKVEEIALGFNWPSGTQSYESNDVPQILAAGASYTFQFSVVIPDGIANTDCEAAVQINAADPGFISEWGDPYADTIADTYIHVGSPTSSSYPSDSASPDDSGSSDNGSPGFTAVSAVGVVGIISLVAIMRKKKAL